MKITKDHRVTVRLTEAQYLLIQETMESGNAKTPSAAVQQLLNEIIIKSSK